MSVSIGDFVGSWGINFVTGPLSQPNGPLENLGYILIGTVGSGADQDVAEILERAVRLRERAGHEVDPPTADEVPDADAHDLPPLRSVSTTCFVSGTADPGIAPRLHSQSPSNT